MKMTIPPETTLTRNDIALLIGRSVEIVRNNERRWGLDQCRINANRRLILYREKEARAALREVGFSC